MYLGIIGKSGCDKIKISRLFGKTIVWIMTHLDSTSTPSFDYIYNFINWCNALNSDQKLEEDNEIYYASFAHPLKAIVSMITGVPFNILSDYSTKNDYIINFKTFEYKLHENETLTSPEDLFSKMSNNLHLNYNDKPVTPNIWMTVNNFVIYFGYYICRNYLGKDIWTLVEKNSNSNFSTNGYRIYTDIRTIPEYEYIREMKGKIIRINQNVGSSIISDKELFSLPVDIDIPIYSSINDLYEIIYKECYSLIHPKE